MNTTTLDRGTTRPHAGFWTTVSPNCHLLYRRHPGRAGEAAGTVQGYRRGGQWTRTQAPVRWQAAFYPAAQHIGGRRTQWHDSLEAAQAWLDDLLRQEAGQ